MSKISIAIVGLTSCSGCQLSLLNCEDELPKLLERIDVTYFPMAFSQAESAVEYDVALVEGCVSMSHERTLLFELRERSRFLIAVGTCAVWGGIAALKNGQDRDLLRRQVYGENAVAFETTEPVPLRNIVQVDAFISGCPPEKGELLKLLTGLSRGVLPVVTDYPVCAECRMQENICLLTVQNILCLGVMTLGGCSARCPSMLVPCDGCRGPVQEANVRGFLAVCDQKNIDKQAAIARLQKFWQGFKP